MSENKKDWANSSDAERERADSEAQDVPPLPGATGKEAHDPLKAHPTLAELYNLEHWKKDRDRELLSLATLPRWEKRTQEDKQHDWGHGIGSELD